MLSLAIDLSSSILLCHFICKANRASPQIDPFLLPSQYSKQNNSIWIVGGPKLNIYFLLLLHSSPASISSHSGLWENCFCTAHLFPSASSSLPLFFFVLSSSLLFPLSHPLLTFQHFLSVPDAWLRLQEFWAARSQIHTL